MLIVLLGHYNYGDEHMTLEKLVKKTILGTAAVATLATGCTSIDSGNVGVDRTFGKVSMEELSPGLHWYWPLVESIDPVPVHDKTLHYTSDANREGRETPIKVLSKNNLDVTIELSVIYRVKPDQAAELSVQYAGDWETGYITPKVRSATRDVAGKFDASDFAEKRSVIDAALKKAITDSIVEGNNKMEIIDVLLRDVTPPAPYMTAIQQKMVEQQNAEKMKYTLLIADQDAQKKVTEATGIAAYNTKIAKSLTDKSLAYEFIQAVRESRKNVNSVVFIPYDQKITPMLNLPSKK